MLPSRYNIYSTILKDFYSHTVQVLSKHDVLYPHIFNHPLFSFLDIITCTHPFCVVWSTSTFSCGFIPHIFSLSHVGDSYIHAPTFTMHSGFIDKVHESIGRFITGRKTLALESAHFKQSSIMISLSQLNSRSVTSVDFSSNALIINDVVLTKVVIKNGCDVFYFLKLLAATSTNPAAIKTDGEQLSIANKVDERSRINKLPA